jgi:hypothetical protein
MDLLSVSDFAGRRGVSKSRVMAWIAQGRLAGAQKIGHTWVVPAAADPGLKPVGRPARSPVVAAASYRDMEARLLNVCAGPPTVRAWKSIGDVPLAAGLAVLLASDSSLDRQTYLSLARKFQPSMVEGDVFRVWLEQSPVRPSRFLPMVRALRRQRAVHGPNISAAPVPSQG